MTIAGILDRLAERHRLPKRRLRVLSQHCEPLACDGETGHANAAWLSAEMAAGGLAAHRIHNRGLFYVLVSKGSVVRPNGRLFLNDDDNWVWLCEKAIKAARWLGYVPFDQITDERNATPVIRLAEEHIPYAPTIAARFPDVPEVGFIGLDVDVVQERCRQPWKIVITGEKTSLAAVLGPIAARYDADLYLPAGEISDTMLHDIARRGAVDGRPVAVFTFADFDPAGSQMVVSVAHKLRLLHGRILPDFEFMSFAPALTAEQVRRWGLPSTPLKATEKRADAWFARYGLEQTEIDALATLRPRTLARIAIEAISPFFDRSLSRRHRAAETSWRTEAWRRIKGATGAGWLDTIQANAECAIADLQQAHDDLGELAAETEIDFPAFTPPEPELGALPDPLAASMMPMLDAINALRERKGISNGDSE